MNSTKQKQANKQTNKQTYTMFHEQVGKMVKMQAIVQLFSEMYCNVTL